MRTVRWPGAGVVAFLLKVSIAPSFYAALIATLIATLI